MRLLMELSLTSSLLSISTQPLRRPFSLRRVIQDRLLLSMASVTLRRLAMHRLAVRTTYRTLSTTPTRLAEATQPKQDSLPDFSALNARGNDTAPTYRDFQVNKPLNPHMTNTNSTIANEMPSLGADNPPPELITNVDPDFIPKDARPENTELMTGGTQKPEPEGGPNKELKVGEIEGGAFRVEPLRRTGEDANTMRARLLCTSMTYARLELTIR